METTEGEAVNESMKLADSIIIPLFTDDMVLSN